MSAQARQALVDRCRFADECARADLLDPGITHTELIALLQAALSCAPQLYITAVRCDHRDDSGLGLHSHANGWCADLWPAHKDTSFYSTDELEGFLDRLRGSPWLHQIGLGGAANTPENMAAAGPTAFADGGEDHIHLGAQ